MLVGQVKNFDGQTLMALGQQAVGLTTGQITNLTAPVLREAKVLESLGQVNGWSRGQSQMLANKILRNNFTVSLGSSSSVLSLLLGRAAPKDHARSDEGFVLSSL